MTLLCKLKPQVKFWRLIHAFFPHSPYIGYCAMCQEGNMKKTVSFPQVLEGGSEKELTSKLKITIKLG